MEEQEYLERFNQGYLLAKLEPKLFQQLIKNNTGNDGIKAMREGGKEFDKEGVRKELKTIKEVNIKNKDKWKDKG